MKPEFLDLVDFGGVAISVESVMCVCVYVCMRVYVYVCMCVCVHMFKCVCVYMCTCVCAFVCMCVVHVCVCTCVCVHVCSCVHVCARVYMFMCACLCICPFSSSLSPNRHPPPLMYTNQYLVLCIYVWGCVRVQSGDYMPDQSMNVRVSISVCLIHSA